MGNRLSGKVAVVTGSTSGIGAGIATALAAEGARVVVSGRRREDGEAVAAQIREAGGVALYQRADVRQAEDCHALCQKAASEFGGLDVLVNNAGIFPRKEFAEITPEFWDDVFNINVRGAMFCSQAAVPLMRERGGGCIINAGSVNAFGTHRARLLTYACSKSALYALSINLARMLAPDHIRVNWVTIGWVLTEKEFEVQEGEGMAREAMLAQSASLPMGEYSTPEDVGNACVFLASDEAAHVTGANLNAAAGLGINF